MSVAQQTFALEGVRCAGCVLKIEKHLAALSGITHARGNATERRLRLEWDDTQQSVEDLINHIETLGYQARSIATAPAPKDEQSLLPRLAVAGFGTMNIMAFSLSVWFGLVTDMGQGTMQFMHWLSAGICLPVMLYSGAVFHRPALKALRHGHLTMDAPITLAIWVTFAGSLYDTIRGADHVYFDAVVSLIFFLLIGRVLEHYMRRRSGHASENLREMLQIRTLRINASGQRETVSASDLCPGDEVLLCAGDRVPADGVLGGGEIRLDESTLTGETQPRLAQEGDNVTAGSIVVDGTSRLQVTQVGDACYVGQMAQMIDDMASHKGRLQRLSDRFATSYIPLVLVGSLTGFVLWFVILSASFGDSIQIAIAVLIVTCPCAAGLATPAVTARAANLAMQNGIVVKSGQALEALASVNQIFIDKTGTASQPAVMLDDTVPPQIAAQARSLAAASKHPLAQALVGDQTTQPDQVVTEIAGQGVEAADGSRLGSARFVAAPAAMRRSASLYFRGADGHIVPLPSSESARPGLEDLLKSAKQMNIDVTLVSGDAAPAVARFAKANGLANWQAEQSPTEKLDTLKNAQRSGAPVLMIGDGINDSVALSGADVSVSFSGATNIAQTAADIVLTRPDLAVIPNLLRFARKTCMLIHQNLAFATAYNVVTVPLALAGFLTPAIAAGLMSSSSVIVMLNGFRLRWVS